MLTRMRNLSKCAVKLCYAAHIALNQSKRQWKLLQGILQHVGEDHIVFLFVKRYIYTDRMASNSSQHTSLTGGVGQGHWWFEGSTQRCDEPVGKSQARAQ